MTHEDVLDLAALRAVGAASAEELARLEGHLAECAHCAGALRDFEHVASVVPLALEPVAPPPAVRERLLRRAASEPSDDRIDSHPASPFAPAPAPRSRSASRLPTLALAASLLVAMLVAAWSSVRLADERRQSARLREEVARIAAERQHAEERYRQTAADLQSITSATRITQLAGQQVAPEASARVFVVPRTRRAYVFFEGLPAAPADRDYQLWIIRSDTTAPQSAGVFDVGPNGEASLRVENLPVDTAIQALAVTLEPAGGVPAPTGEKYLVGS